MSAPQSLHELFSQVNRQDLSTEPEPEPQQPEPEHLPSEPSTSALKDVLTVSSIVPDQPDLAVTGSVAYHMLVACSAFPTDPEAAWRSLFYNVVHNVVLRGTEDPSSNVIDMAAVFGSEPGTLKEVTLTPESEPVSVYDVTVDPTADVTDALDALTVSVGIGAGNVLVPGLVIDNRDAVHLARIILDQVNTGATRWLGFPPGAYTYVSMVRCTTGLFPRPAYDYMPAGPTKYDTLYELVCNVKQGISKFKLSVRFNLREGIAFDMNTMINASKSPFTKPVLTRWITENAVSVTMVNILKGMLLHYLNTLNKRVELGITQTVTSIVAVNTTRIQYHSSSTSYYYVDCVVKTRSTSTILYFRIDPSSVYITAIRKLA
jgi:hypothetical protein